jgi:peptide/nickel transport system ATP-binding protein
MSETLVDVKDLKIHFFTDEGVVRAVDGVDLDIKRGKTLALVGESGCGKSVACRSLLQIVHTPGKIVSGEILYHRNMRNGLKEVVDIAKLAPRGRQIRDIRGKEIAMIFQEPMTSLSPVHTVGSQIMEAIELHQKVGAEEAASRAIEMLEAVGIGNARQRMGEYPHQLSGGQRQRAMIAMALSCNPALLIADEPTTALDVTIQAQILELMVSLQEQFQSAILMITHNLGVIAEMADRVAVMYMGKIVESGDVRTIFNKPVHPYSVGLLQSIPKMGHEVKRRLIPIPGSVPDPFSIPQGCAFYPRCPAPKKLACQDPAGVPLVEIEPGHKVRCTLYF